jgi:tetratricopeptide (TPR) repeat protein
MSHPHLPVAVAALAVCAAARAQQDPSAIWTDPTFRRQFIASYGVHSEIEPRIGKDEIAVLEKVQPLLASDLPKAEQLLRKSSAPDGPAILDFTLGTVLFQQDKVDESLASYQRAVAKHPSFKRAWRNLGIIQVRRGNWDGAIEALTRMIVLGGGDAYAYGLLGFAHANKHDWQPAEAAFRTALLLQPDNTEWRLGLTQTVFKQDKFEDAAALLDVLIERHPEKADFWLLQAHTFLGMKKALPAAANLEVVERLGKATANTLQTLGDVYLGEGLFDLAAGAYGRVLDAAPQQPLAGLLRSAETLAARGGPAAAQKLVARIRELRGKDASDAERRTLLKLEARLALADGGGAEAVPVLEEIVRLDPLDGEALLLLGKHHVRQNEPDRAIFWFERAASVEAFEVDANVRHAQVLVGMGRYGEAVPLLRRAQQVRPREEIARYLEQVDRMARAQR